mgnify:CR=1 FL=1
MDISPNRRWILFSYSNFPLIKYNFAYVFPTATTLKTKTGHIHVNAGDMMRIEFKNHEDPTSPITYMYLVQRIMHANGKPTKAYYELQRRLTDDAFTEQYCLSGDTEIQSKIIETYVFGNDQKTSALL